MKIKIKKFDVDMDIKASGIEFGIRDPQGQFLGDLVLTMSKLIWCKGKTGRKNGKSLSWTKFIKMMDDL